MGKIPSPGGKVARRKPGRMRNGDAVGQGMHPNKTDKGFGFNHFYGVHRNILLFAVPHQSPKSVPKCRFGRQLYELRCDCHWQSIDFDSLRGAPPPGEAMGAAAPIRYTTVNVLTKADSLNEKWFVRIHSKTQKSHSQSSIRERKVCGILFACASTSTKYSCITHLYPGAGICNHI